MDSHELRSGRVVTKQLIQRRILRTVGGLQPLEEDVDTSRQRNLYHVGVVVERLVADVQRNSDLAFGRRCKGDRHELGVVERTVTDVLNGGRNGDSLEVGAATAIECLVCDGLQTLGQIDRGDLGQAVESIVADGLQLCAVRNVNSGNGGNATEGSGTDLLDSGRQVNGGQLGTTNECTGRRVAFRLQITDDQRSTLTLGRIRDSNTGQRGTLVERTVADGSNGSGQVNGGQLGFSKGECADVLNSRGHREVSQRRLVEDLVAQ